MVPRDGYKGMKAIILGIFAMSCLGAVAFSGGSDTYETAKYAVEEKDGAIEVRDYEPMLLVTTPMQARSTMSGSAFGRLFRYISGSNETREKIPMTSPVFTFGEVSSPRMSFVIPADVARRGAPSPTVSGVEIEPMKGGRFAAYRFGGYATESKFLEGERALSKWIESRGLEKSGDFIYAGYDSPYTPSRLRRNEVLVRIAE